MGWVGGVRYCVNNMLCHNKETHILLNGHIVLHNYIILFQILHETLSPEGLMLTAAVPAGKTNIDTGYDVPAMSQ